MKETELEYANRLIDKYNISRESVDEYYTMTKYQIIKCAIQDVENTIEALDKCQLVHRRYYMNGGGFGDDNLGKEITDPDINNDGRNYIAISNDIYYYQNVLQILKDKL